MIDRNRGQHRPKNKEPVHRPWPGDDTFCTGFDVPGRETWGPEDNAFWTATPTYQPWKDVAAYFRK